MPFLKRGSDRPEVEVVGNEAWAYELDFTVTEELKMKGLARELTNRIQRLRKASKLAIDDRIFVVVDLPGASCRLAKAFATERASIQATLKKPLFLQSETRINQVVFEEAFDIEGERVRVMITTPFFMFDWEAVAQAAGDEQTMRDVVVVLGGINYQGFRESGKEVIEFQLGARQVRLENKKHFKMDC